MPKSHSNVDFDQLRQKLHAGHPPQDKDLWKAIRSMVDEIDRLNEEVEGLRTANKQLADQYAKALKP